MFGVKFYVNEGCLSPVTSYIFEKAGNISNLIVPACSDTEETVTEDDLEIANSLLRCILNA